MRAFFFLIAVMLLSGCGSLDGLNRSYNFERCKNLDISACAEVARETGYAGQQVKDILPASSCVAIFNNWPGARLVAVKLYSNKTVASQPARYQQYARTTVRRGWFSGRSTGYYSQWRDYEPYSSADIALHIYPHGSQVATILFFPAETDFRTHDGCYLFFVNQRGWYWPQTPDRPPRRERLR